MLTVLYIFQFIIAFLLVFFIFLQKKEESSSLLSSNAYNSMFKSIAVSGNPLVKITLIIGVLFFLNSILIGAILLKSSNSPSELVKKVEKYNKINSGINKSDINSKNHKNINKKDSLPVVPLGNIR